MARTRSFGIAGAAVVQHLDLELVARPVEPRGGGGDAHGERTFVADRKLDQNARQRLVRQERRAHARRGAVEPEDSRARRAGWRARRSRRERLRADIAKSGTSRSCEAFGPHVKFRKDAPLTGGSGVTRTCYGRVSFSKAGQKAQSYQAAVGCRSTIRNRMRMDEESSGYLQSALRPVGHDAGKRDAIMLRRISLVLASAVLLLRSGDGGA